MHSFLRSCGTPHNPPLFREASLLPSLVQVLPSPMLLSFIWHKILRLFVSVSSRAPHGIANAWPLADTQQVSLDWIHSGKLRANAEAAPCHPGEGSRKYREELLEEGSLVSFSAGRAVEWWSECLLSGACSGSGLVLLKSFFFLKILFFHLKERDKESTSRGRGRGRGRSRLPAELGAPCGT